VAGVNRRVGGVPDVAFDRARVAWIAYCVGGDQYRVWQASMGRDVP
jgi:hypothetical protein